MQTVLGYLPTLLGIAGILIVMWADIRALKQKVEANMERLEKHEEFDVKQFDEIRTYHDRINEKLNAQDRTLAVIDANTKNIKEMIERSIVAGNSR